VSASVVTGAPVRRSLDTVSSRPALTVLVFVVTSCVSIAALVSPALMRLFVRDLPKLKAGQWWRVVTPVLVQPSGWGQLVFNVLGIAVVGIALQRHLGWAGWSLTYLLGGSGGIVVYSAWHPADTGGGSSAAVAALIGALALLLAAGEARGGLEWFAQLYSVFFAVYLSTLDLGGVVPSIIAGNATIIVMVAARRVVSPTAVTRACLVVVLAAGIAMTAVRDDHGVGIVVGLTVACLALAFRGTLTRGAGNLAPHSVAPALTVFFDLVAPTALFYGLRAAGVGTVPALVVGATVPAVNAIFSAVRHRRIDALAVTVLTLLVLSAALSVIAGSARFLLAKDAALTTVWGAWFFVSLWARRPLAYEFTRPLLEGHRIFDSTTRRWVPPGERSWDDLWTRTPHFRRLWQVTTVIWGAALLFDAVVRVVMAYTLPLDEVPAFTGGLWLVTLLVLQVSTNVYLMRSGLWVMLRGSAAHVLEPAAI
jgi:Rhomboid family